MSDILEGSFIEPNGLFYSLFEDINKSSNNLLELLKDYTFNLAKPKFSSNLTVNNINKIFKYSINLATEKNDEDYALIFYKNLVRYNLNNKDNPFTEPPPALPKILEKNIKAKKINHTLNLYWTNNFSENKNYLKLLEDCKNSNHKELLKFLLNPKYQIKINTKDLLKDQDSEILQILQLYFNNLYHEGYTDEAIKLLNLFPNNWKTFWNAHLCKNQNNEYIDGLIYLLKNEKHLMEHQNILLFQVSLKELLNYIDTGFEDYSNLDPKIITKVSTEVEKDLAKYKKFDDDLAVDLFAKKLYKFVIFDKATDLFNSIPKKTSREHRVALYIDFKQIFEACIENDIKNAQVYLESINKILFAELKDKTSGTNLIIQMLNNKKQKGLSLYITQLSYILDPNSLEMESLFEALIIFFNKKEVQKRQLSIYLNSFKELEASQFKILYEFLITFNKNENNISTLTKTMCNNLEIFKQHSQTFYILIDAILNKKFNLATHQVFIATLLSSNLNNTLSRNFLYLLVDHFYEQPYRDFKKNFPHTTLNYNLIEQLIVLLDQTKVAYLRDKESFIDLEDKRFATQKTKDFLMFLLNKAHIKKITRN